MARDSPFPSPRSSHLDEQPCLAQNLSKVSRETNLIRAVIADEQTI
jgi:hypothetical protein